MKRLGPAQGNVQLRPFRRCLGRSSGGKGSGQSRGRPDSAFSGILGLQLPWLRQASCHSHRASR
eukprot:5800375-Alexandrium_andersonii.AAC.1